MFKTSSFVVQAALLFAVVPKLAFSFGHGPQATISSVSSYAQKVWIVEHNTGLVLKNLTRQFHVGDGRAWSVVTALPNIDGLRVLREVDVPANMLLVFGEGKLAELSEGKTIAALTDSNGLTKQMKIVTFGEYTKLQKNPFNFIYPINLKQKPDIRPVVPSVDGQHVFPSTRSALPENFEPVAINFGNVMQNVKDLSGVNRISVNGQDSIISERGGDAGRKLAQSYLVQYYQRLGLVTRTVCYTAGFYKGCNVEATKLGSDVSRFVYVTSHLDSVRNAGADDNGSGTATVMETARVLANLNTKTSVRFVSFDQEELGLVGSEHYAKQIASTRAQIVGVVNMDMIGYNSKNDGAIHVMDCDRPDSKSLSQVALAVNTSLGLGLRRIAACTDRSDHASFWDQNIPAIVISENFFGGDSNRCYHQQCDKINMLNEPYFEKTATFIVNTIYALANR